ncbi:MULTISPECIES: tyrosine-type recombinase/integrase [Acidaminococcus]|uniref:tyrosine-type recombinase/integrase n=1 Tax=Acidaminococcus TaxID=904 RepID=UPI0026DD9218|nr:tyrosine-type recombinase/integrase [Acidaminococcus massiliensis]
MDNKRQEQWGRRGNSLCSKYKDRGYIFTTDTGMPYNLQYINKQLRAVDIPGKHITTHVFRHAHISLLVAMGVPLKAIMQRVGHNDPKTTLAIYTHVTESMEKQLQDSLEKMSI